MDLKIILGIIAALFAASSAFFYIKDIFKGNTKPHIYTWIIWTILTLIGFLGQLKGGAEGEAVGVAEPDGVGEAEAVGVGVAEGAVNL